MDHLKPIVFFRKKFNSIKLRSLFVTRTNNDSRTFYFHVRYANSPPVAADQYSNSDLFSPPGTCRPRLYIAKYPASIPGGMFVAPVRYTARHRCGRIAVAVYKNIQGKINGAYTDKYPAKRLYADGPRIIAWLYRVIRVRRRDITAVTYIWVTHAYTYTCKNVCCGRSKAPFLKLYWRDSGCVYSRTPPFFTTVCLYILYSISATVVINISIYTYVQPRDKFLENLKYIVSGRTRHVLKGLSRRSILKQINRFIRIIFDRSIIFLQKFYARRVYFFLDQRHNQITSTSV